MKSSSLTTFLIGMKSGNVDGIGQKWITFKSGSDPYGSVRDGNWHVIDIPMPDMTTEVDLSQVSQLFQVLGITGSISDIELDDICFTGGGSPQVGICDPLIAGDFNGSGKADLSDFARLASYWMETDCDELNNYCEGADHVALRTLMRHHC